MNNFNLSHLKFLTDDFGIWQFCSKEKILKEYGYTLDDNARALILSLILKQKKLADIYFNYLKYSYRNGFFYGEISAEKKKIKKSYPSSEDSFGEAIWALGLALNLKFKPKEVLKLFNKVKLSIKKLKYARGLAYSILGLIYLDKKLALELGKKLIKKFPQDDDWFWPESRITYGYGIIPYTFLRLYLFLQKNNFLTFSLKSLDFLDINSWSQNIPMPVGNKGWYLEKDKKPKFDQQPVEVSYLVMAFMAAFQATGKRQYIEKANKYFEWFEGSNILKIPLYDQKNGRVNDGIVKNQISLNCGAESVICYFLAKWMLEKGKTI